jgi:MFS transporter, SP family, general alpha glucoside:H+ symporter
MSKELDISHVEKRRQSATSFAHGDHVDKIGLLANQEEHEISKWAAIKKDPWTLAWCIYAIWVLVLNSFENQAGGAVLGIPQFRKDFGYAFGGDYVLPAKWQSAFSGGPVAS